MPEIIINEDIKYSGKISVCSEVFGKYHSKESFKPTVIKKSDLIKDK